MLYVANRWGTIEAYRLRNIIDDNDEAGLDFVKMWAIELDAIGSPTLLPLPMGIVLPDEGLLLAHRDLADERLILLNGENNPIWQRSYSHASGGSSQLLESGDYPYLILSKMITFSIK